jgi:hypothetical protein
MDLICMLRSYHNHNHPPRVTAAVYYNNLLLILIYKEHLQQPNCSLPQLLPIRKARLKVWW